MGDAACRPQYVEALRTALRANLAKLGEDSQRRTETNPLRVLDSKVPEEQELIASLPKIGDHLCGPCRDHFAEVRRQLELLGIPYRLDARLVRGLDYYVKTTFEVVSGELGRPEQRARRRPLRRPRARPGRPRHPRHRLRRWAWSVSC